MLNCEQYNGILIPRRTVLIAEKIDDDLYEKVQPLLLGYALESAEPITVIIDSRGGDVRVGLRLYDYIRAMPGPTRGIVMGKCWSIAIPILQACTMRIATEHSTFVLHEVHCSLNDFNQSKKSSLKFLLRENRECQWMIEKVIIARSQLTLLQLRKYMREGEEYDVELPAAHALKLGLIDEIVTQPFAPAPQPQ